MEIHFKNKGIYLLTCCFTFIFSLVQMQELDLKCLQYKKQIFEVERTFGFFIEGAEEKTIIEDHCSTVRGFVVGGVNALPKEFAFAARLGNQANDDGHVNWFCGGTLISENFVLTAAHCFYASLGEVNIVRLGELDFGSTTDDADPTDFGVQELIEYPGYEYDKPYDDIGLVMLSTFVKFNRYKHPACLPVLNGAENTNNFIAIGWGHLRFGGKSPSHLQKVNLKPYSYSNCQFLAGGAEGRERLPKGLLNSQLCAGSTESKDTCQGDSGGPLLTQHANYSCMYNIVGVTSTGYGGCGTPNTPALYTRVKFYMNWINFIIEQN